MFVPLEEALKEEHFGAVTTELFGPFQVGAGCAQPCTVVSVGAACGEAVGAFPQNATHVVTRNPNSHHCAVLSWRASRPPPPVVCAACVQAPRFPRFPEASHGFLACYV